MKRTTNYGPCPVCAGTGFVYSGFTRAHDATCLYCNGSRQVIVSVTEENHPIEDWKPTCGNNLNRPQTCQKDWQS